MTPTFSGGRLRAASGSRPLSSILLASTGGFMFVRPAFLPEDLRYIGGSLAQIGALAPRIASWLHLVCRVLGGFIFATGTLVATLAATSFRARDRSALAGALVAGVASIGCMVVVNFVLDSDYKWMLLLIAVSWATGLSLFCLER